LKIKAVVHNVNVSDLETTVNAFLSQLEAEGHEIISVQCLKPMLTVVAYKERVTQ
jgi:hypothetical protein